MKRVTDFFGKLSDPISKSNIDDIVESVHHHPEDFKLIYDYTNHEELKISWRALWACEKLAELHPDWFDSLKEEVIHKLLNCTHAGSKRILLSILYNLPVYKPIPIPLLDYCFSHMLDMNESIGVQSLAIKMAYKICCVEPELLYELKLYLENAEPEYYSTGVKTCIRNTLRRIE
ncbi:hypothetical protein [Bacteroides sp. 224]|uniref:hypothetical protein n=1 Tax=Bacteroides sp. 224 TaxID=2302936 RepID=UPI0013D84914|nr:hypothetical protein [Bacteroides sp. 224]NDV64490.1 hypothetical protein [Bacteroides sp. 224]